MAFAGMILQLIWPIRFLGRLIVDISSGLVSYERLMAILRVDAGAPRRRGWRRGQERLRGEMHFQRRVLRLRGGDAHPQRHQLPLLPGAGRGAARVHGLGQDEPREPHARGSTITRGAASPWTAASCGSTPATPCATASASWSRSRSCSPGRIRENITYGMSGRGLDAARRGGGPGSRDPRRHPLFPEGLRDHGGREGRHAVGRPEAAGGHRPHDPQGSRPSSSSTTPPPPWTRRPRRLIRAALEKLMQGRTSFIIAHRIQSLMRADLILVFDGGRIVERGTHATLLAGGGHVPADLRPADPHRDRARTDCQEASRA